MKIKLTKVLKLILVVMLINLLVGNAAAQNNEVIVRQKAIFLAHYWIYYLQSPVDPRQLFVAELESDKEDTKLIKLVYLPKASRLVSKVFGNHP